MWKSFSKLSETRKKSTATNSSPDDFLKAFADKIQSVRSSTGTQQYNDSEKSAVHNFNCFRYCPIEEVRAVIMKYPTKSCSLDPIPTFMIKDSLDALLPYITAMCNKSLQEGFLPQSQRHALVTPILKRFNLDSNNLGNFRPISNLTFLSKLIERLVFHQLETYLRSSSLMPSLQSAYRKHHSTETALLKVSSDLLMAMDSGMVTLLGFLDLSAAFDTVDKELLIYRLEHSFGLQGTPLGWINSFLTDRTLQVVLDGQLSAIGKLDCGVPQGSVLGPLLVTMYTAELFTIIEKHGINGNSYADDTKIYHSVPVNEAQVAVDRISRALEDIHIWMDSSRLKLNADKTQFIWIGSSRQIAKVKVNEIQVSGVSVPLSTTVNDLGMKVDSSLSMSDHIDSLCRSCLFQLRQIRVLKRCLPQESVHILVKSFVSSRLDYCNSLLYGVAQGLVDKVQRIQNTAARLVSGRRKYDHITPVLRDLHWLPIRQRIEYKLSSIVHRSLHGQAPTYLTDACIPVSSIKGRQHLRSAEAGLLITPRVKTNMGARAFNKSGPSVWNSLPVMLRNPQLSLSSFQKRLKTVLFDRAFN